MCAVVAVLHDSVSAERVLPVACALVRATDVPLYAVDVSILSWLLSPECVSWMWAVNLGQNAAAIDNRCQQASIDYGIQISLRRVIEKSLLSVVRILRDVNAQSVIIGGTLQCTRRSAWLRRATIRYPEELATELRESPRSRALTVVSPNGLIREFGALTGVRRYGGRWA